MAELHPADEEQNQEFSFELAANEVIEAISLGVERIRDLSRQQVDTWKRIPFWTLLAEGRSGYSDSASLAYADGLWLLNSSKRHGSYCAAAVDLDNGEIVHTGNPQKKASDELVLSLAPDHLDEINAEKILDSLVAASREPVPWFASKSAQELAEWHREQMEKHGITEYYVRERQLTAEEMEKAALAALGEDLAPS